MDIAICLRDLLALLLQAKILDMLRPRSQRAYPVAIYVDEEMCTARKRA